MTPYLITTKLLFALIITCNALAQNKAALNQERQPILYLYDIANQTQEDIAMILGPQSSLNVKDSKYAICANCQKYSYQNDKIIIEYTNDMADRITIRPAAGIEAKTTPFLLGLPEKKPDIVLRNTLKWKDFEGIREVDAILEKDGSVRYILIKVLTD